MTLLYRTFRSAYAPSTTIPTAIPSTPRRSTSAHHPSSPPPSSLSPSSPSSSACQIPNVPSPVIWRYSSSSNLSSYVKHPAPPVSPALSSPISPNNSSMTNTKPYVSPLRLALIVAILIYIFVPSHILKNISSHPGIASVSDAGKRVFQSLQSTVSPSSTSSESNHLAHGECQSNPNGVSIVAACMNRHETLRRVLPTWLSVRNANQLVIVDWSSDPPLESIISGLTGNMRDSRLKIIRVNNESTWILTRAYNLAVTESSCPYILRTDCDYELDENFLVVHDVNATDSSFYTGNWREARNDNEAHLNGAMVVKRQAFLNVGGYDERIQTYGWDDEDLYTRLESSNLTRRNVSYDYVTHTPHDDASRAQSGVKFAQVQIDVNRILLDKLPTWTKSMFDGADSSRYRVLEDKSMDGDSEADVKKKDEEARYIEVTAEHSPAALQDRISPDEVENAWLLALGRRLADDYGIPWDVMTSMSPNVRESLLRKLMRLQDELDMLSANGTTTMAVRRGKIVPAPTMARVLIVHCQHGLGNRLRALGSALAFAKSSHRVPIVIWESDAHIAAEFTELFEIKSGENNEKQLVVTPKFTPKWPFANTDDSSSMWSQFKLYNYMELEPQSQKQAPITNDVDKHLYYKGAYIMEAWDYTWWESANEQLRSLVPVSSVREQLAKLKENGIRDAIGVHIRNKTLDKDIDMVDSKKEYSAEAGEEMEQWRRISCVKTFVTEMERILQEEESNANFYVASDTWQVLDIMERKFPGKILTMKRTCDDRDAECVKWAVIDLYALSYTKRLLGSNWSSYTEAAQRLGGVKAKLSGVDFGPKFTK